MLRVWVCAAHMGGFFESKILKTRVSFSADFQLTWVGYPAIGVK